MSLREQRAAEHLATVDIIYIYLYHIYIYLYHIYIYIYHIESIICRHLIQYPTSLTHIQHVQLHPTGGWRRLHPIGGWRLHPTATPYRRVEATSYREDKNKKLHVHTKKLSLSLCVSLSNTHTLSLFQWHKHTHKHTHTNRSFLSLLHTHPFTLDHPHRPHINTG